ncbi:aldehyde dehydrogenase family protein [Conexibacter arvalis]|uniref:Aldehyde dehydrogenase (NAD+) n=1 Tax=Conexibacter arvalis TaxID=912552 RepID=A0A840IH24_9ACTN|nr:aldehyde dehydrogenase (NAD+) [Conexibacter arvalis]
MIVSRNPADPADEVGRFEAAGRDAVDAAMARAVEAQRAWEAGGAAARAAALDALADALRERAERLAALIVREVGKPLTEARGEVARAVAIVRYHGQSALDADGELLPPAPGTWQLATRRRPRGVCALITPWNFPLAIPLWKAAPALAAGNAVALKVAEEASACGAALAELFAQALPDGVATVLHGGAETGGALLDHPATACLSFTGSTAVGTALVAAGGARSLPVQAEMGGQNPSIVLADADLDHAAATIAHAAMGFAGQKCTATSRVIVERSVLGAFTERLVGAVRELRVGAPADAATAVGPLIDDAARDRALAAIAAARGRGAELLCGGEPLEPGSVLAPTLLALADPGDPLGQDELFAPVACVLPADDLDAAIASANGVRYGLAAAVFTRSLEHAARAVDALDAGLVRVNQSTAGVDLHAPFGGTKASSFGTREQGRAARDFFTETRTVSISL